MTIIVHGVWGSPYLRGALLGLEERQVAYRVNTIPFGDHLQPAHLARHPFGRVPVLDHDDFRLYETQAILRYVTTVFPGPALVPADAHAAARMDQFMGITDWYFFNQIAAPITRPRILQMRGVQTPDEQSVRAAVPQAKTCLKVIDELKGDAPYLTGDAASLADLLLAPHMAYFAITPEGQSLLAAHPRLLAWNALLGARPSMQATDPMKTTARAA